MDRLNSDLQFLEELRRTGSLSDAEVEQAKATLTEKYASPQTNPATLAERRRQRNRLGNEQLRIEQDWRAKRERLKVHDRYGLERIPTKAEAVLVGIALAAGGIFVAAQTGRWEISVPLGLVSLIVGGVASWGLWLKAKAYEDAEAQYKRDMMALRDDLRRINSTPRL